MSPIQFSGLYRISGENEGLVALKTLQIKITEPSALNVKDGKDIILITQKDAAVFLKQELDIEIPENFSNWGLLDSLKPKNLIQNFKFKAETLKHLKQAGKPLLTPTRIVDYFKNLEVSNAKDADGNDIQHIQV